MPSRGGNVTNLPPAATYSNTHPAPIAPLSQRPAFAGSPNPTPQNQSFAASVSAAPRAPSGGIAQTAPFTQSTAYKQAVLSVFNAQSPWAQKSILSNAITNPSFEGRLVVNYLKSEAGKQGAILTFDTKGNAHVSLKDSGGVSASDILNPLGDAAKFATDLMSQSQAGQNQRMALGQSPGPSIGGSAAMSLANAASGPASDVARFADPALQAAGGALNWAQRRAHQNTNVGGIQQSGFVPSDLFTVPARAGVDTARALGQDPSVLPKTISGLGDIALATAPALAQAGINVFTQGPGPALGGLASQVGHDYSTRYGPFVTGGAGGDKAFINRIKQQGAAPELIDFLGLLGGVDATGGRALTSLGKTREAITGKPNFLTRERPALRTSGGDVRPQQLGAGALRITAQRAEDRLRAARGSASVPKQSGEVTPLFAGHATRVLGSRIVAQSRSRMQSQLDQHIRAHGGAEQQFNRLSRWERRAMPFAIEGIPLHSVSAAREWISQRIDQITHGRMNGGPTHLGNTIPSQYAHIVDELPHLHELSANAEKWVTPRLAAYVSHEAKRSADLEANLPGQFLRQSTAEARRLRPQGEMLGIEHPQVTHQKQLAALTERKAKLTKMIENPASIAALHNLRASLDRTSKQIAKMEKQGPGDAALHAYSTAVRSTRPTHWPEPGYIKHSSLPHDDFSAYAGGAGARAMQAPKRSGFVNWHAGVVDRRPQVYFDSLARTIKGAHQWHLVDELSRRNAIHITPEAIKDALGKSVHRADLTGQELKIVLAHMGVDLRGVNFLHPGRLRETTLADQGMAKGSRGGGEPNRLEAEPRLSAALGRANESNDFVHDELNASPAQQEKFNATKGAIPIPRDAMSQIRAHMTPSGKGGRYLGKVQGALAGAILTSPSFVVMNTLAHVYLAAFGTRGRLLTEMAKMPLWWHGLSKEERAIFDSHHGGRGRYRLERMGSLANHDIVERWRTLKRFRVMRLVGHLNPVRALFHAEDLQSNFFRRTVAYHELKRAALNDIAHTMGPATDAMDRFMHTFTSGPKDQMARMLRSQAAMEEVGRYTVDMMGDYARFTPFERKWINNRSVLFYSFLRHATRTLLYVLPFKHPLATAIAGELGKLHKDEVDKLLGGHAQPWDYGRIWFDSHNKLKSIDLLRASPVGGAVADIASQGVQGAARLIAPEAAILIDQIYGHTSQGKAIPRGFWSAVNELASITYAYRAFHDQHFGLKEQQADSIPFLHERPQNFKSKAAQEYQAAKQAALGPLGQHQLAGLLGLYPKPDDALVIAAHQAAAAEAAKRAKENAKKGKADLFGFGGGGDPFGGSGSNNLFGTGGGGSSRFQQILQGLNQAAPGVLAPQNGGTSKLSSLISMVGDLIGGAPAQAATLPAQLLAQGAGALAKPSASGPPNGLTPGTAQSLLGPLAGRFDTGAKPAAGASVSGAAMGKALAAGAQRGATISQLTNQFLKGGGKITNPAGLTAKGQSLNATQVAMANRIIQIGHQLHAPPAAIQGVLFSSIYESDVGTNMGFNPTYGGILGGSASNFPGDPNSSVDAMITAAYQGGKGFHPDPGGAIALANAGHTDPAYIGSQVPAATPFDPQGFSTQYQSQSGTSIPTQRAEAIALFNAARGGPKDTAGLRQFLQSQLSQPPSKPRTVSIAASVFPPGSPINWNRADQGRDLETKANTPIIANGSGYLIRNGSNPGGFGTNYPIVHFTSGPWKGLDIYFGHTNSVLTGKFKAGDTISHTGDGTGPTVGNATGIPGHVEIGLAPGGNPGSWGQALPPGLDSSHSSATVTVPSSGNSPVPTSSGTPSPSAAASPGPAPTSSTSTSPSSTPTNTQDALLASILGTGNSNLTPQQQLLSNLLKGSGSGSALWKLGAVPTGGTSFTSLNALIRSLSGASSTRLSTFPTDTRKLKV